MKSATARPKELEIERGDKTFRSNVLVVQPLVVTWLCKKHHLGAHKGKFGDLKEKTMATGDALAKGGIKAQFPPAGGQISQERWDAIWSETLEEVGERGQKKLEIKKEE